MNGLSAHGWSGRGWKGKEWLSVVMGVVSRRKEVEVKKSFRVGVEAIEAVGGFEDTLSTAITLREGLALARINGTVGRLQIAC